jgi:2-amino-4-hydroxy-6-hydroxymethyldihydropteridine diphosphokinase
MASRAYIALGSNIGDRAGFLLLAVQGILEAGIPVTGLSRIYETEPLDVIDQPEFLNMVAESCGDLPSPEQLLARLLRVETALGRRREALRGPRTIDLDLLLYDENQRSSEYLMLPHPRLHMRRFVLAPLAELAPHLIPPGMNRSISELLDDLKDAGEVKLWTPAEKG